MKTIFVFVSITLVIFSCCTKKKCYDQLQQPYLYLKFENFPENLVPYTIYLFNKTNSTIEDSIPTGFYATGINSSYYIDQRVFDWLKTEDDSKKYSYIIKTDFTMDTIESISFIRHQYEKQCNQCFPKSADEPYLVEEFVNFTFRYQNQNFTRYDTLKITF